MKKKRLTLLLSLFLFFGSTTFAQGRSDSATASTITEKLPAWKGKADNDLPIHRLQIRAADMPKDSGRFCTDVVRHVAGVPDDHVVVADRFAVQKAVEVCLGNAAKSTRAIDAVVKL